MLYTLYGNLKYTEEVNFYLEKIFIIQTQISRFLNTWWSEALLFNDKLIGHQAFNFSINKKHLELRKLTRNRHLIKFPIHFIPFAIKPKVVETWDQDHLL